jgi:putative spermidine/putrescine transport system permease protein
MVLFLLCTIPLELQAMQTNATTPIIYTLGTLTTALSLGIILACLLTVLTVQRRRAIRV